MLGEESHTNAHDERALPYARRSLRSDWSSFQVFIAWVCGLAYLVMGALTVSQQYEIWRGRPLFPLRIGEAIGLLALVTLAAIPLILVAAFFTKRLVLVAASSGLVALGLLWLLSLFSQL